MNESEILERMASEGAPRGADEVWADALRTYDEPVRKTGVSNGRWLRVAFLLLIAGLVFELTSLTSGDAPTRTAAQEAASDQTDDYQIEPTDRSDAAVAERLSTGVSDDDRAHEDVDSETIEDPRSDGTDREQARDMVLIESTELGEAYAECVNRLAEHQFVEHLQLFTNAEGTPVLVKSVEVPAVYHVPCFTEIGGSPRPAESSWGPTFPGDQRADPPSG